MDERVEAIEEDSALRERLCFVDYMLSWNLYRPSIEVR